VRRPLQGHGGLIDGFLRLLKGPARPKAAAMLAQDRASWTALATA
jgi:type IV secretion system protein VirB4